MAASNSKCYTIRTSISLTWTNAMVNCDNYGSVIAPVESTTDNTIALGLLNAESANIQTGGLWVACPGNNQPSCSDSQFYDLSDNGGNADPADPAVGTPVVAGYWSKYRLVLGIGIYRVVRFGDKIDQ